MLQHPSTRPFLFLSLAAMLAASSAFAGGDDRWPFQPDGTVGAKPVTPTQPTEPPPPPQELTREDKAAEALEALYAKLLQEVRDKPQIHPAGDLPMPKSREAAGVELKAVSMDEVLNLRLLGHANLPIKLLMVLSRDTKDEVQRVFEVIKQINDENGDPPERERLKLHLIVSSASLLKTLHISKEDFAKYVRVDPYFNTRDIWMQDWGEIAAVYVEGARKERTLVLDTNRGRGLAELPGSLARTWNTNFLKGPKGKGAGNYGGNIEVMPDDNLVIGDTSSKELRDLFERAGYRDRTCVLETEWLVVGHVDEYLTFLPTPGKPLGFTIVRADPRRALQHLKNTPPRQMPGILRNIVHGGFAEAQRFEGVIEANQKQLRKHFDDVAVAHAGLHGHPINVNGHDSDTVLQINEEVAQIIDRNVEKLTRFLKAKHGEDTPIDFISVPCMFTQMYGKYVALLPGVANMVVLRDHLIIPDPLVPAWRDDVRGELEAIGYKPHFIPNLTYHDLQGQLHCGTNVFRHPNKYIHPRYEAEAQQRVRQAVRSMRFAKKMMKDIQNQPLALPAPRD